jgi:hypothetical protein
MTRIHTLMLIVLMCSVINTKLSAQNHSVARQWNDVLLEAIRGDLARPTVHSRNLFHISAAMYDAWAIYDEEAANYLIGNTVNGFRCEFNNFLPFSNVPLADQRNQAISYAAFRLLLHRFEFAPDREEISAMAEAKMQELGYDISITSTNYSIGSPAALGNYIAQCYISYGLQDGSNEEFDYVNFYYEPVNEPLAPTLPGNPNITELNRWQPLALSVFIDQSGNVVSDGAREFLGAEWGNVMPFSLANGDKSNFEREGDVYHIYNDPGHPPYIEDESTVQGQENDYRWNFELVSIWGAHLDPSDGVMWDISPASLGNIESLPENFTTARSFYNEFDGGDSGQGYSVNPVTNLPYVPNIVPRGDYTRVLAEYWADGPASETPPGHWFTILNYVNDHPLLIKKFKGQGEVLDDLEWDIKAYFLLGGAMHDAAISAWGIKGWYDYIRPISAIRAMASKGQSSDPNLPSYNAENGITLKEGYIELVTAGDPLAGGNNEHVDKIKVYTWRGPDYIQNPEIDEAGVGWILADNWWPYQRPTFVTPPFAGYISGHSTFSRTAAVILAELTGSEFFPGGMGEFIAPKNEFLVFEEGPSVDITLQWATYRDASDQTSLSRIWGGIHPPADDIPGRIIGEALAPKVFEFAENYFQGIVTGIDEEYIPDLSFGPNPVVNGEDFTIRLPERTYPIQLSFLSIDGTVLSNATIRASQTDVSLATAKLKGVFLVNLRGNNWKKVIKMIVR